ncbi:nitroreductase family protein [Scatolibacter rhodanostii]|uniref:nitroreductase family protein n=1 Tax=Scatolibacter rhodanostii TaxID=2014781 RepID=UPI000C07CAB1|nr:nitroreductase family protein [Scatolibacter rhodanostii]
MKMDFSVEETVKKRQSVRSYLERPIPAGEKEQIQNYMAKLNNPFSVEVSFHLLENKPSSSGEKLGTYGVIKGASDFIGASVAPGELGLEALGYSFEQLILYLTSLGFGTCWLGGTFDRSGFAAAMKLKEGELFPAISPIGYPQEKRRMMDSMARFIAKSDQRLPWETMFFKGDFSHTLTQDEAGAYAFPLEMLRLAPSAANKQPWRVVQDGDSYHFYEMRSMKDNKLGIDIQRTDVGIGACHFHLAAQERDLSGQFVKLSEPKIQKPEQMCYLFSWKAV